MEKPIKNFTIHAKDKAYKEAEDIYQKKIEDQVWEKVNNQFFGFFGQVFWFSILFFLVERVTDIKSTGVLLICIPIWSYFLMTRGRRKEKAFKTLIEDRENIDIENETKEIFNIFLKGKKEVEHLGKAFYIKSNNITGNRKRVYFGEVFISLEKNPCTIYIIDKEEFYEKDFVISDIIRFKMMVDEEVSGIADYSEDLEKIREASNRAEQLSLDAQITQINDRSGGLHTTHSKIIRDKARLRVEKAIENLNEEINKEEERVNNEKYIRLLEFKDGDYLLISHLDDSSVKALEEKIELQ